MSDKNWLIRTRQKKILGPVSKNKIIELLEGKNLNPDDEVSSGNGYWFWVKEQDLLDRYIYGDIVQGFNPVTEAKDIIFEKRSSSNESTIPKESDPVKELFPDNDDLDYPDMGESEATPGHLDGVVSALDITLVANINDLQNSDKASLGESSELENREMNAGGPAGEELPSGEDLEYPDTLLQEANKNKQVEKSKVEAIDEPTLADNPKKKKRGSDRYLFFIIVVLLVAIAFILNLYYELFYQSGQSLVISSAHAQSVSSFNSLSKKKVFLS